MRNVRKGRNTSHILIHSKKRTMREMVKKVDLVDYCILEVKDFYGVDEISKERVLEFYRNELAHHQGRVNELRRIIKQIEVM